MENISSVDGKKSIICCRDVLGILDSIMSKINVLPHENVY